MLQIDFHRLLKILWDQKKSDAAKRHKMIYLAAHFRTTWGILR